MQQLLLLVLVCVALMRTVVAMPANDAIPTLVPVKSLETELQGRKLNHSAHSKLIVPSPSPAPGDEMNELASSSAPPIQLMTDVLSSKSATSPELSPSSGALLTSPSPIAVPSLTSKFSTPAHEDAAANENISQMSRGRLHSKGELIWLAWNRLFGSDSDLERPVDSKPINRYSKATLTAKTWENMLRTDATDKN